MRFSVEWLDGASKACAEERATLCRLRIFVGDENACVFYDPRTDEKYDHVVVPAVHLAEGIATEWWSIFGGRDREHSLLPWRTGFVLPDIRLRFDGATFEVVGDQLHCDNPKLRFWLVGTETLSRDSAESVLSHFVERVIDKLSREGVTNSEVALCWSRVSESRADPEERPFCEATAALGADPYSVSDADASFIEAAGGLFVGEALIEFLAGVGTMHHAATRDTVPRETARTTALENVHRLERRPRYKARLPELHDAARQIRDVTQRCSGERSWAPGYRAARAFRKAIGVSGDNIIESPKAVAGRLGGRRFAPVQGLSDILAVIVSDESDVRIHLRDRGRRQWSAWAENFAFARAVGDVVCYPEAGRSVVNNLHNAERQAAGRAFAAEFLAPVEKVLDMMHDGRDVEEISASFNVTSQVIAHQIENRDRIRQACGARVRETAEAAVGRTQQSMRDRERGW